MNEGEILDDEEVKNKLFYYYFNFNVRAIQFVVERKKDRTVR